MTTSKQTEEMFSKALALLGYTQQWLDCGVLTDSMLQQQAEELTTGEDEHTEHYRYRTFSTYLKGQHSVSNNVLHKLLDLINQEVDMSMAGSAMVLLLKQTYLTDEQFALVSHSLTRMVTRHKKK